MFESSVKSMLILGGTATNGIDIRVAEFTKAKHAKVENKVFPDGESYIRIPVPVGGEEVVIVQSTYPPQNKHLMELFLMAETCKDLGAQKVTAVVPYLAYSRQNRRFLEGESVSVKTVLNLIKASGVDVLIVVEPHTLEEMQYFKGDWRVVDAMPSIAKEIMKLVREPIIVAPDRGAVNRAKRLASFFGGNYSFFEKERDRTTGNVRIKEIHEMEVRGKDVVLIDDIISTGNTMALTGKALKEMGARSVIAVAIHGFLNGESLNRLKSSGIDRVFISNTIPSNLGNTIDVSEQIVQKL